MKLIPLTRGLFAQVDDADYGAVSAFKWYAQRSGNGFYAARGARRADGRHTIQYLHQFLMPGAKEIDHIDGNSLNNCRSDNLRACTHQQNLQGFQRKKAGKTSKFRGVCWFSLRRKWKAEIKVSGRTVHLGVFSNEEDAARAYDDAARKFRGEFASPNFKEGF